MVLRKRLEALLRTTQPEAFVGESRKGLKTGVRIRDSEMMLASLAAEHGLVLRWVAWSEVAGKLGRVGTPTRLEVAETAALWFPELAPIVPPPPRAWTSIDCRQRVLEAVVLCLGCDLLHSDVDVP